MWAKTRIRVVSLFSVRLKDLPLPSCLRLQGLCSWPCWASTLRYINLSLESALHCCPIYTIMPQTALRGNVGYSYRNSSHSNDFQSFAPFYKPWLFWLLSCGSDIVCEHVCSGWRIYGLLQRLYAGRWVQVAVLVLSRNDDERRRSH